MIVWFPRLYLFLFLFYSPFDLLSSLSTSSPLCHPDDTSALLQFKNSLSISKLRCERNYRYIYYGDDASPPCQTMSWKNGTDCCRWDGVTCDDITGHVIGLNLTRGALNGTIQSNSSLFRLAHLKSLILSRNDFTGSRISSEFGRFENMMHLDLSDSNFTGQVAPEISYLSKLHTIDLSRSDLRLEASTLKRIIENTTNLTQLFLSDLDMSSIAPISLMNLSSSLKSLNLSNTRLQGKFPEGMFRRPNLQVLNLLGDTNLSISFPKYNWSSPLKQLSLSSTNIPIDLPYLVKCFQNLNALTLTNCHFTRSDDLTPLSNLTKLTWLDLSFNNFSGQIPWNSLNLERFVENQCQPIISNPQPNLKPNSIVQAHR
ncbi:hypothetical protein UlMin_003817 [Ulmus minor]